MIDPINTPPQKVDNLCSTQITTAALSCPRMSPLRAVLYIAFSTLKDSNPDVLDDRRHTQVDCKEPFLQHTSNNENSASDFMSPQDVLVANREVTAGFKNAFQRFSISFFTWYPIAHKSGLEHLRHKLNLPPHLEHHSNQSINPHTLISYVSTHETYYQVNTVVVFPHGYVARKYLW
mmetsp:Transcript_33928/g.57024  ORF Transcript_33928/g.57024 Transcript_33928/m.57024 type:complete len:177 (-) Transcript_33928:372-902(-)